MTLDISSYLSVSELTKQIKNILESKFNYVLLRGEVSNFRPSSNGHWYFVLKDNNSSIKAIVFKGNQAQILSLFSQYNIKLKDGIEVLCEGRINVYEKNGEYSIIISTLAPLGIGNLTIKFEQLKEKLFKEGLFDESRKKQIPKYPEKIGIVTSPTGAALQDILNIIKRRSSALKIIVFPTSVQGESAKDEIVKAIQCASFHYINNTSKKVDVLIIARGGGSIEDLWAFNEEVVAYAIANCPIPTVTGIGHEIDFTIADFCADLRAPTPSASAELVTKNSLELLDNLSSLQIRLKGSIENILEKNYLRLRNSNKERLTFNLKKIYENFLQNYSYLNDKFNNVFFSYNRNIIHKFNLLKQKLSHLNPNEILDRGYSIVLNKNKNVITNSNQVSINDDLNIILSSGEIESKIIKILK